MADLYNFYTAGVEQHLATLESYYYKRLFAAKELEYKDAMKILVDKTYTKLPTCIAKRVLDDVPGSKDAMKFAEEFYYRQHMDKSEIIEKINIIIRNKISAYIHAKTPFISRSNTVYNSSIIYTI